MAIKVIITGATGMVGEGVLLECLQNEQVSEVLIVNRRHYELSHPKLKELLIPDFMKVADYKNDLQGYDACFYCAGITSIGASEAVYTHVTYDTTLHFAEILAAINPDMVFDYVSGAKTDSSEKGRFMWMRVKGRTENALMRLTFKGVYNFRPGVMQHFKEQQNVKPFLKLVVWIAAHLFPAQTLTLSQVGRAMINTVLKGYEKQILEVRDIKALAAY